MRISNKIYLMIIGLFLCSFLGHSQYKQQYWESRNEWQKVPEMIKLMEVKEGMQVADIGCHEGFMTVHLSNYVGESGKVYAVDIVKSRIEKLEKFLKENKKTNVKTIVGKENDPLLPKNTLDAVIIMDTYHEMDEGKKVLRKVYKSLKDTGRILILEEIKPYRIDDSRESQTAGHDIALRYVKKDLEEVGFIIEKEIPDFGRWENKENEQMWILVATKK